MAFSEHVPLGEVATRLAELVERVEHEHGRVVITADGRPAAVLISVDDLESLEETLEIMSDRELMAEIREAEREIEAGEMTPMTKAQALALIQKR